MSGVSFHRPTHPFTTPTDVLNSLACNLQALHIILINKHCIFIGALTAATSATTADFPVKTARIEVEPVLSGIPVAVCAVVQLKRKFSFADLARRIRERSVAAARWFLQ